MNYTIKSRSGWQAGAHTQAEAIAKAWEHKRAWFEVGRDMPVSIYYRDGSEIEYTGLGKDTV